MKSLRPTVSYFAISNFRSLQTVFGMYQHDRMVGVHIVGKTGTGKTNLIETLLLQDIFCFRGACIFDVAGDLAEKIRKSVPNHYRRDIIYFDVTNPNIQYGYNPLKKVSIKYRHLVVSHMLEAFEKIWGAQSWGTRIEYTLRNVLLTLLDQETATFSDIPRILTNEAYRDQCMKNIRSSEVRNFWAHEFSKYGKTELIPVLNKVGGFLTIPIIKRILVENTEQISFTSIVNEQKVLVINMAKGSIGRDAAYLLGSLILGTIATVGFNRASIPEEKRRPFFVYLDEFQNYTTLSLVEMFSELRKFKVGFIIAHQYLNQLSDKIRDAVLGNIGTLICFRLSFQDAQFFVKEMYPVFEAEDFTNLENHHIFLKLLINGRPSTPFSAITITPQDLDIPKSITTG